jgi:hypothetical protein
MFYVDGIHAIHDCVTVGTHLHIANRLQMLKVSEAESFRGSNRLRVHHERQ